MPTAIEALRRAARGLLFPSETDEPFHTFQWKDVEGTLTAEVLRKLGKQGPEAPIEEISLDDFFGELTEDQDWHDDEDKRTVERFRRLREIFERRLSDVRAFRVGQVRVDYYVVGKEVGGDWVGVKTSAVET